MNARKEEQKHGKVTYLKLDLNAGSKFAGMKLDETKKICDMSISGGTKFSGKKEKKNRKQYMLRMLNLPIKNLKHVKMLQRKLYLIFPKPALD